MQTSSVERKKRDDRHEGLEVIHRSEVPPGARIGFCRMLLKQKLDKVKCRIVADPKDKSSFIPVQQLHAPTADQVSVNALLMYNVRVVLSAHPVGVRCYDGISAC